MEINKAFLDFIKSKVENDRRVVAQCALANFPDPFEHSTPAFYTGEVETLCDYFESGSCLYPHCNRCHLPSKFIHNQKKNMISFGAWTKSKIFLSWALRDARKFPPKGDDLFLAIVCKFEQETKRTDALRMLSDEYERFKQQVISHIKEGVRLKIEGKLKRLERDVVACEEAFLIYTGNLRRSCFEAMHGESMATGVGDLVISVEDLFIKLSKIDASQFKIDKMPSSDGEFPVTAHFLQREVRILLQICFLIIYRNFIYT